MLVYDRHDKDMYYLIKDGGGITMYYKQVQEYLQSGGTIKNLELKDGVLHSDFDIQRGIYMSKLSLLYGIIIDLFPTENEYPYIYFFFTRRLDNPVTIDWSKLSPSLNFKCDSVSLPVQCTIRLDTEIYACDLYESFISLDITDVPFGWLFNKFVADDINFMNGAELVDRSLRSYPAIALGYLYSTNTCASIFSSYSDLFSDNILFLFDYDKSKLFCRSLEAMKRCRGIRNTKREDLYEALRYQHFYIISHSSDLSDEFNRVYEIFKLYFLAGGSSDKIYNIFLELLDSLKFLSDSSHIR